MTNLVLRLTTWAGLLGALAGTLHAERKAGEVLVTVVSHFDHPWNMEQGDIEALRELSKRHPAVRWTHLYNPAAYTQETPLRKEMEALVKEARGQGGEIGVHTHMFRSLVEASGVTFRDGPHINAQKVEGSSDPSGYAVPMTAYTADEIGSILEFTLETFAEHELGRPRTFCAGFYATNLALQREIVRKGFTVSAAALPPGREIGAEYQLAWQKLSGWDSSVTHLTPPYLVSRKTILPGGPAPYLTGPDGPLIEVPQTCKIDWMVSVEDMKVVFQKHVALARRGTTTAVCFALHEEHAANTLKKYDEVLAFVDGFLGEKSDVRVRYVTCSQLRERFLKTLNKQESGPIGK